MKCKKYHDVCMTPYALLLQLAFIRVDMTLIATGKRKSGGRTAGGHVWLVVATFVVLHIVLWKAAQPSRASIATLVKRATILGDAPAPDEDSLIDYRYVQQRIRKPL